MKKIIITTIVFLISTAGANAQTAQKKHSHNLPPLGFRCTEDLDNGIQCKGWSRPGEEYCVNHSPYYRKCNAELGNGEICLNNVKKTNMDCKLHKGLHLPKYVEVNR